MGPRPGHRPRAGRQLSSRLSRTTAFMGSRISPVALLHTVTLEVLTRTRRWTRPSVVWTRHTPSRSSSSLTIERISPMFMGAVSLRVTRPSATVNGYADFAVCGRLAIEGAQFWKVNPLFSGSWLPRSNHFSRSNRRHIEENIENRLAIADMESIFLYHCSTTQETHHDHDRPHHARRGRH